MTSQHVFAGATLAVLAGGVSFGAAGGLLTY